MATDFPAYDSLSKIKETEMVKNMMKISQAFTENNVPIPDRIEAINLLRCIHKYEPAYFKQFFGAIKLKFISNCLLNDQNPRLQQTSLFFLYEIFDDNVPNSIPNDFINSIFENLLKIYYGEFDMLKGFAEKVIKLIVKEVINSAKFLVLFENIRENDDNKCDFIYKCLQEAMISSYGLCHLSYDMDEIISKINDIYIEGDDNYKEKIKQMMFIFKKGLEPLDENEMFGSLNESNKEIYKKLTEKI